MKDIIIQASVLLILLTVRTNAIYLPRPPTGPPPPPPSEDPFFNTNGIGGPEDNVGVEEAGPGYYLNYPIDFYDSYPPYSPEMYPVLFNDEFFNPYKLIYGPRYPLGDPSYMEKGLSSEDTVGEDVGPEEEIREDAEKAKNEAEETDREMNDDSTSEDESDVGKSRQRRQTQGMELTWDTPNRDGSRRSLYKPRFFINGGGTYNNRENYAVGYNAGLGSLLWRSKNKDMSLGASITGSGNKARYGPYKFGSLQPSNLGYNLGFTYRF